MGLFSRSSKRKSYKYGNHGSHHYKKKGLLDNLLHTLKSRSHSGRRHDPRPHYHNPHQHGSPNKQSSTCHKCQSQIPAGSKFCLQCGEKVNTTTFCMSCGEKLPAGAKFCSNCGSKAE